MNFGYTNQHHEFINSFKQFFTDEILPRNRDWHAFFRENKSGEPPLIEELKQKAMDKGFWNMGLPRLADDEPGTRLTNFEFAPIAETMGRLSWGSLVFNCHAPDTPNMQMMQVFCTSEQKKKWLRPILEGRARSGFAMTEPTVASSDATNISTTIEKKGDHYVINGHKWFAGGAAHPKCKFIIVVGVTNPEADRRRRQSMIIVPIDSPGLKIIREINVFSHVNQFAADTELYLKDVKVPVENLLGQEGDGFLVAQARLGTARIHHCMRSIGLCEVLIELMMARAEERSTFGRSIIEYDTIQRWIAESRLELEQARLLVHKSAWMLDTMEPKASRREVSMIKVAVARTIFNIADRAVQLFGAMGVTDDTPLAQAFSLARTLRIFDGPDEVHLRVIFRLEKRANIRVEDSPYMHPTHDMLFVK